MAKPTLFTLTEEHIKLLQAANWHWEECEYGAPAIDCKRPFGNSDVESDVIELLGWATKKCKNCGDIQDEGIQERASVVFHETLTAIEVILSAKTFRPGVYTHDGKVWKPVIS